MLWKFLSSIISSYERNDFAQKVFEESKTTLLEHENSCLVISYIKSCRIHKLVTAECAQIYHSWN